MRTHLIKLKKVIWIIFYDEEIILPCKLKEEKTQTYSTHAKAFHQIRTMAPAPLVSNLCFIPQFNAVKRPSNGPKKFKFTNHVINNTQLYQMCLSDSCPDPGTFVQS